MGRYMNEHYFEKRGIAYRMNEFVPGRLTLVFIHGAAGSASAWLPYEDEFGDQYNIVTYDQRGHGKSRHYGRYADYHIDRLADDLHELLEHIGDHRYVLVGHSFGAIVTLAYLRVHQRDVVGTILLSPDFNVRRHLFARITSTPLALLPLLSYLPFSGRSHGRVDYRRFIGTGDWNILRSFADLRNTGVRTYLYCIKQSYMADATNSLEHIEVPALLVHGTADTIFPVRSSIAMSRLMPRASLITLAGANHILVLNNPQEIMGMIHCFVRTKFSEPSPVFLDVFEKHVS
jgi:pimeloyl-ACP methyl ester carboxylesterase